MTRTKISFGHKHLIVEWLRTEDAKLEVGGSSPVVAWNFWLS
jgi:hypothetical protein